VPSTIVRLTAFPTTPSGKVDRRALPAPTGIDREANQTLVPPQDEIETKLVRIWEKLLEVNPIGVTDNFFDLGGHSLLITLLLIEIELLLARRLPVTIMFQAPTIRQLADIIRQQSDAEVQAPCVAFLPEGDQPPLFCIHGAKGNLMFCHGLGMYLDADRPVYGIQEPLRWRGWALPSRLEEIAAHYIDVMREVQPQGPYFLMGYCFGGVVAFEMAQQLTAQGETVGGVFLLDPDLPVTYSRIFKTLPQLSQVRGVPFLLRDLETHMLRLSKQTPIGACCYVVTELQKKLQKATPGKLMEKLRELSSSEVASSEVASSTVPSPASPALAASTPNQAAAAAINPDVYRFMNYHRAIVNYIPQFYPHPVTLLITETTYEDFGLWGNWLQLAPCETKRLPGHHKSILREPDIQKLAEAIRDAIA
jgi:thioesterase domain-containing protein